ncbi:kelch-like protein 33 [Scleropages formosus]|uniref:kelch-like protein 33 n=1 Tax=Scleropages formosus TaxID=113540 RepID=UPI0010FA8204|nr:kelch-like protein 33 [Scleropages formosus]
MSRRPGRERIKKVAGQGGKRGDTPTGPPPFNLNTNRKLLVSTSLPPDPMTPPAQIPGTLLCHLPSYCDSLFSGFCGLRDQGLLMDCSLHLSGVSYGAHRLVLAAISHVAEGWLRHGEAGPGARSDADEQVSPAGLQAVLEFAYTGDTAMAVGMVPDDLTEVCRWLGVERLAEALRRDTDDGPCCPVRERELSLGAMRGLWEEGVGCDVWLQVDGGESFPAHRVVLAAAGDYFRALLCGGLRESSERVIVLPDVAGWALHALLGFLYSGTLCLGWEHIWELTEAARRFQLQGALTLCQDFLKNHIDANSCLDILVLAETYGLVQLGQQAEQYALRHFSCVAGGNKFRDLPVVLLEHLLKKDTLCVDSEVQVFRAVQTWVEDDLGERLCFLAGLLEHVRFGLMSRSELQEVQSCSLLSQDPRCRQTRENVEAFLQMSHKGAPCKPRTHNQVLVVVGGDFVNEDFTRRVPSRSLWFAHRFQRGLGLIRTVEWRVLPELPEPPRFRHCVCVLHNQLYVLGGRKYYGSYDVLKSVMRLDPTQGHWEKLADMHSPRDYFAAVCLEGKLYVLGGNRDDTHYLDSVEFYSPEDNTWSFAHPLDTELCGHAAAVLNEEIFISGGFNTRLGCLPYLWRYDPCMGSSYCAPMTAGVGRAGHAMLALGGRLLVAGGLEPLWVGFGDQLQCEAYNPALNTWTPFPRLPRPHLFPAATLLEGLLYLLGGSSADSTRDTPWVHCYDPHTQCWEKLGSMPHPYADLAACTLQVPRELRE